MRERFVFQFSNSRPITLFGKPIFNFAQVRNFDVVIDNGVKDIVCKLRLRLFGKFYKVPITKSIGDYYCRDEQIAATLTRLRLYAHPGTFDKMMGLIILERMKTIMTGQTHSSILRIHCT